MTNSNSTTFVEFRPGSANYPAWEREMEMEQTQGITIEQLKQEELLREILDDYYSDPWHDPDYYDLALREEMALEPRSEYPAPKRQEGGEVSW